MKIIFFGRFGGADPVNELFRGSLGYLFGTKASILGLFYSAYWFSRTNFDQMLGLGLKQTNGFANAHLGILKKLDRSSKS